MKKKVDVGIIGSGNIGTDLMYKLLRNDLFNVTHMIGIDSESEGMRRAAEEGLEIIDNGIDGLKDSQIKPDILFDATSAKAHEYNNQVAQDLGIKMIDLTPAAIGPFVSPTVNMKQSLAENNVNLITCGGQATTPIVSAINEVADVEYAEIVATISSASAGPGTRANIDEFTQTTALALETVGGADKGKAIILLNPAEPPILMRDTVYCLVKDEGVNHQDIIDALRKKEAEIQQYVPGYRLRKDPLIDGKQVTVFIEVEGAGDFLPPYSGNLDIMTASAVGVAESFAKAIIEGGETND